MKIQNRCYLSKPQPAKTAKMPSEDLAHNFAAPATKSIQNLNLENLRQFFVPIEESETKSESFVKIDKIVQILKLLEYQQAIVFYNDKGRGDQIVDELA